MTVHHLIRPVICFALSLVMLSVTAARPQSQIPPGSNLQQMKDKLDQLEQEVQDLKGQISAVEQRSQLPRAAVSTSSYGAPTASGRRASRANQTA